MQILPSTVKRSFLAELYWRFSVSFAFDIPERNLQRKRTMKTILTTAAVLAALALPAFAEGEQPSDKAGEPKGSVKASSDVKQEQGMDKNTNVKAPSTMGSAQSKSPEMNDKAGDTGAGNPKK